MPALAARVVKAARTPGLRERVAKLAARALAESYATAGLEAAVKLRPDFDDPHVKAILKDVAARVTKIEATTAERLNTYVARGIAEELTVQELARVIAADASGAFSRARAETIARSETSVVYNRGSVAGYRASGRVEKVKVHDGADDGGCAEANGAIWDLDFADDHPLEHPNCQRAFSAIVDMGDGTDNYGNPIANDEGE